MEYKHYTLSVTDPEYWQEIHDLLCDESDCDYIPNRCVECTDPKHHSPTRGTFLLTESEVQELTNHPKISWIELSMIDYPNQYPQPEHCLPRWPTNVKIYRDLDLNRPPTSPTSADLNRTNWALKRTTLKKNSDFWNTITGEFVPPVNDNINYTMMGNNVDIVIHDSGILQYHPEFMDVTGKSRVRDIVLDGPYYIDPAHFNLIGATVLKPDGRIGITRTSAINWWQNAASRSSSFSAIGTFIIPSLYTEENTLGTNLNGTNGMTDSHGTACASLSAGKNFGTAFAANIWSIFGPTQNPKFIMPIELAYDLMKIFHLYKPTNPSTGVKNPTIINASYAYVGGFTATDTISYRFKNQTGTFTGNAPATDPTSPVLYAKESLTNNLLATNYGAYRTFNTESSSSSVVTSGEELMNSGVIFVSAAGNQNQRVGVGSDDPHRLDYYEDSIFGIYRNNPNFPAGCAPSGHRDWLLPCGLGFDSVNDFHPVINVGAMDEFINGDYSERKAFYSNNGPGIDVWAPADETLAAGISGLDPFRRVDNSVFFDRLFNGTSAAAPVVVGIIAIYLQLNPLATSAQVKNWLSTIGSQTLVTEYLDQYPNESDTLYWSGTFNMRGAPKKIVYNPYENSITPTPTPPEPPTPPTPLPPIVDDVRVKLVISGDTLLLDGISIE
jgi:hypothetical protein